VTGRAGRRGNAVEARQQFVRRAIAKADVERVRQPLGRVTVQDDAIAELPSQAAMSRTFYPSGAS
jgi:hypothetical protein